VVLIALGMAAPAGAAIGDRDKQPFQNDVVDPCPTYDSCTMYYWSSATNQMIPTACKNPGGCRTCDNIDRCRTVYLDANCACDDSPVTNAGPGITTCTGMVGSCVR